MNHHLSRWLTAPGLLSRPRLGSSPRARLAIAALILPVSTLQCGTSSESVDGAGGQVGGGPVTGGQASGGSTGDAAGGKTSTGGRGPTSGGGGSGGALEGTGGWESSGGQPMGGLGGAELGEGGQLGEAGGQPQATGGQTSAGGAATGSASACDLLAQDCSADRNCIPTAAGAQCVEPPEDPVGQLEQCDSIDACDIGLFCRSLTPEGSSGLCMELCDTTTPTQPCGDLMSCMPLDTLPHYLDHPDAGVGLCTPCSSPDCEQLLPGGCSTDDDCAGVASLFGHDYRCDTTVCVIDL